MGTGIGELAPPFSVTAIDGSTVSSDALRGRSVVLTSAAAWCPTCALEAEQLSAAHRAVESSSVVFLTVDIDPQDSLQAIDAFRERLQTPWAYAAASSAGQLIRDFHLSHFEMTYLIDAHGIVRFRDEGITKAQDLAREIQHNL